MNWTWRIMLAGPLIWTGHFFLIYGVGEFGGVGVFWRALVLLLTFLAIVLMGFIWLRLNRRPTGDDLDLWQAQLSKFLLLLSALAVIWQTMPALFP